MQQADVIVIGAGAAGCFAAIQAGKRFPGAEIVIVERGPKPLQKVKISGGGRCNVTNICSDPAELSRNYPRGERFLKKAFHTFSSNDMVNWLKARRINLREYPDGCLFPESNDSQTIIDCFLNELSQRHIPIHLNTRVDKIIPEEKGWTIETSEGIWKSRAVILTTGGQPKKSGFKLIEDLNIAIVEPVPSLFTFNLPDNPIRDLMGIVQQEALVRLTGEKWTSDGPLLITHWGMSGPAVLKGSAFGARILADKGYNASFSVNWTGGLNAEQARNELKIHEDSTKKMSNTPPFGLKTRLWDHLLSRCGFAEDIRWSDLGKKGWNRLLETLVNDLYEMKGKTTFKEEFVTAGGISLTEIDVQTMQVKRFPGLFVAGEVMDIDAITGGYNFQGAWTTGFIAGNSVLLEI